MVGGIVYDILVRKTAHRIALIQDKDAFLLTGHCKSKYEIQDPAKLRRAECLDMRPL